jgi:proteasome lid subunit RPN8/RPN11
MKIDYPSYIKDQIINHARLSYPMECCGFVLNDAKNEYLLFKCLNISPHPNSHFLIAKDQTEFAKTFGEIVAFYHSHTCSDENLSTQDIYISESFNVDCIVYCITNNKFNLYKAGTNLDVLNEKIELYYDLEGELILA